MNITSLVVVCVVAALLCLYLRQHKPEYALLVSLASGILILLYVVRGIGEVSDSLQGLLSKLSVDSQLIVIVFKCLGICILAELGSQCCRDAGETAMATKVELAAKVALVLLSLPLFSRLADIAERLLEL